MIKLDTLATVRTGIVMARNQAKFDSPRRVKYGLIGLGCFGSGVKLNGAEVDKYYASGHLNNVYLTMESDVIVRLRSPNIAIYIDKEDKGLLVSSLLTVIRVNDSSVLNAKYLAHYINSRFAQRILNKFESGTAISMIKTNDIKNLEVALPSIERQKEIVEYMDLAYKEQELARTLLKEKEQLLQTVLDTIIQQNKDNN